MAEFRKDPVTDLWVIVAPERAQRPMPSLTGAATAQPERCPFCAGNEDDTPAEVFAVRAKDTAPNRPGWSVRVVPNRYPALAPKGESETRSGQFFKSMAAHGVHEVIIESSAHIESMAALGEAQIGQVVRAYRQRMVELGKDMRWRSLLLFKNQGIAAGASLLHAHAQLVALPMVAPALAHEIDGAKVFHESQGGCVYCEMITREISARARVVSADERYVALCPYGSRIAYETWILPRRHGARFETASPDDDSLLARTLRPTLQRIERVLESTLLNLVIHSGPPHLGENPFYHWHIEILPRLIQAGGFEWGSGSFINSVRPEDAAQLLREVAL